MLKLLISLLFIFSLSLAITREDVIKLAEERTSQIKLSKKDLELVEAQIKEVMSNIYPHLEINGIYTKYDPNYVTGFSLKSQYRASISLKQTIFDKSVFESIKIAKLNRKLQKLILKQVKNEVLYTALTLYEDILYKKNLLQIKQKTLNYWQKQLEFTEENYKQGFINKFEYLRTKAQYENAIAEVELARINYQKALVNLEKFLFINRKINPNDNIVIFKEGISSEEDLKNNPQLKVIEKTSKIKKEEARFYTSSLYPKLYFQASYEFYNTRDFPALNEVVRKGYVLNLSLNWQFFDGLNAKSKAIQSKINSTKEKIKYEEQLTNLEKDYETAVLDIKASKIQLKAINQNIKALEQALKLATERYKYKVGSIIEVLEAQKNLEEAYINRLNVIYQHNLAILTIKKLTGEFAK
ncbi:MAG: hypothetical protein DSY47_06675 [Hydrogenothermus sp.]|nr:MAG: hypothetical protein DSY47_06675 [Hydrogenothermus sp.]